MELHMSGLTIGLKKIAANIVRCARALPNDGRSRDEAQKGKSTDPRLHVDWLLARIVDLEREHEKFAALQSHADWLQARVADLEGDLKSFDSRRRAAENRFLVLSNPCVANDRLVSLAGYLRPHKSDDFDKIRLGNIHDGGYVLLNDFADIVAAFSFGIERDASWDADIAARGIDVYQYDHTVETSPIEHPRFRFHQRMISPFAGPHGESIASIAKQYGFARSQSIILKIDIEHDEWDIFDQVANDELSLFSQIICEFHGFKSVLRDDWYARAERALRKLNEYFAVVHVHANNYSPMLIAETNLFPDILEVCYVSRNRYNVVGENARFPVVSLDSPNNPEVPEHFLGSFLYETASASKIAR